MGGTGGRTSGNRRGLQVPISGTLGLYWQTLVEEYEKENFPIEIPSLSATMSARLEENHWTQKEMAAVLGMTAARLNAILSGKANPTFEQARIISTRLHIDPAIVLV